MISRTVRAHSDRGQVLAGVLLALLLHVLQVPIGLVVKPPLAYIGLTQWLYLIPAMNLARRKGYGALSHGVALAGAAVLLLNAAACAVVYYLFFVPR
jgi:hypothetical protein